MTTYNYYNTIPVKRNTTVGWASDVIVYPAGLHLQVTDDFYTGTNQPRFKIANGIDDFATLDYVPTAPPSVNIYNTSDSLTGNRVLDGDGYSLEFSALDTFNVTTSGSVFGDQDFVFSTASGVAQIIYGDKSTRFYGNIGVGDAPISTYKMQVYGAGMAVGINSEATASGSFGVIGVSSGANGKGGAFTCQSTGGTGVNALGDAVGMNASSINGDAIRGFGTTILQHYGGSGTTAISAIFQVESTTKGVYFKPMTTAQRNAIASPVDGLEVNDSNTNSKWRYDGTNWIEQ